MEGVVHQSTVLAGWVGVELGQASRDLVEDSKFSEAGSRGEWSFRNDEEL